MKVIRNVNDHDEFWSESEGWVSREDASEYTDDTARVSDLPHKGEWVPYTTGKTYKIVRKFKDQNKEDELVKTGLTWDEARDHCSDPSASGDGWMDVFYEE